MVDAREPPKLHFPTAAEMRQRVLAPALDGEVADILSALGRSVRDDKQWSLQHALPAFVREGALGNAVASRLRMLGYDVMFKSDAEGALFRWETHQTVAQYLVVSLPPEPLAASYAPETPQ